MKSKNKRKPKLSLAAHDELAAVPPHKLTHRQHAALHYHWEDVLKREGLGPYDFRHPVTLDPHHLAVRGKRELKGADPDEVHLHAYDTLAAVTLLRGGLCSRSAAFICGLAQGITAAELVSLLKVDANTTVPRLRRLFAATRLRLATSESTRS